VGDLRYYLYSVAQYVHDRREERLNLGVVVWDAAEDRIATRFSSTAAVKRIKSLYPEVDRMGLQLYLEDLAKALPRDERLRGCPAGVDPLNLLEAEWRNAVRFTPSRSYPSTDLGSAADALMNRFVDEQRVRSSERTFVGVERAKRRTVEAIESVLNLPAGRLGYSSFQGERVLWQGPREVRIAIDFPFQLYQDYLIDTISFEGGGRTESQRTADAFLRKLENVKKMDRQLQPHATVAVDPHRRELGLGLIAYMQIESGLDERAIREADEAEVVVASIKEKLDRAA
jgi:hypothetical protein